MIKMPHSELRNQSRAILDELGASLSEVFNIDNLPTNPDLDALIKRLDDIPYCRSTMLDMADARVCRMLENDKWQDTTKKAQVST
jgi:hypothetical protein